MRIKILSDMYLEPHMKNQFDADFFYSESLEFPQFSNEKIVCVFSNIFRNYSASTRRAIRELKENLRENNEVLFISDLEQDFRIQNIFSDLSNYDFNIGYYSQMPFNSKGLNLICSAINSFSRHSSKGVIKCYFVDLDNTLIPGVWEEDKEEIKSKYSQNNIGHYHNLASFLKMKASLGSQIIIVSKNDLASIQEALNMIWVDWSKWLTHIDAGWNAKHFRIQELLNHLNIGADDCIFIDDNPIEINSVKEAIPLLNVIQWQNSYKDFLHFIQSNHLFDDEISTYVEERRQQYRRKLNSQIDGTIEATQVNFKYNLFCNQVSHFMRVLELSKKTNQFNLAKNVLTNADLKNYTIYTWDCHTDFGYLGVIGYAIVDKQNSLLNFVMSCRALGFKLEYTVFEKLYKTHKFQEIPLKRTDRNSVAQDFVKKIRMNYAID